MQVLTMKNLAVFIACVSLVLPGCQSVDGNEDDEVSASFKSVSTEGMEPGCFYPREVSDWEELNNVNILIYTGNKTRAYLLTISPPAVSLRDSSNIGFAGVRNRVCGRPGERLLVGVGARREYAVMDVRRLDAATLEGLLQNKQANENKSVEPAEKSPGAEIETDIKPNEGEDK
jgi:hypothetical protein